MSALHQESGGSSALTGAMDGVNVYTDDSIYMFKVLDLLADP